MKHKIYLVTYANYDDYAVCGIYTRRGAAVRALRAYGYKPYKKNPDVWQKRGATLEIEERTMGWQDGAFVP